MANIALYRGNHANLEAAEKVDGNIYLCLDDGTLFYDYIDTDDILQRKQINAKDAATLANKTLEEIESMIVDSIQVITNDEIDTLFV